MQFPYLYTSRPRAVALAPYHHPPLYYVKPDDPDLPAFYFDPVVNPISAFRSKAIKETDDSEDDFSVMGLEPLLSERPLYTDATAGGIALYFAPRPFNLRRGRTRRAFDVPLVNAWFKERSVTQRGFRTFPNFKFASPRRRRRVRAAQVPRGSSRQGPRVLPEAAEVLGPQRAPQEAAEGAQ